MVMSELLGWSLRFVCLFAGIALISAESAWAQEQDGKVLVTASLISDVNSSNFLGFLAHWSWVGITLSGAGG
jgi:hypothetical protein